MKSFAAAFLQPLPQWTAIALPAPQESARALLRSSGEPLDVTADHTIASLKPLMLALGIDAGASATLDYIDCRTGTLLGLLRLTRVFAHDAQNAPPFLYRIESGQHHCLNFPRREWNAWMQNRAALKQRKPHDFWMPPPSVQQLMIAYLCPRPVVLVSVSTPDHRNIFPMDLIGPLERSGWFSLALRSTNISIPAMKAARRVALSCMPASMKADVYKLGGHHKHVQGDWSALPFAVQPSREFGIPAAAAALQVQELAIADCNEIGSHTFFIGRIVADEHRNDGAQLHHTAGFHQAWRNRRGIPFEQA